MNHTTESTSAAPGGSATDRLIARVARRVGVARLGGRAYGVGIVLAVSFALWLVAARLLGRFEAWTNPWLLLALPAVALAVAAVTRRRADPAEVAHLIDDRVGAKGLFLAARAGSIGAPASDFDPAVRERAERRAASIDPRDVVRFEWWPRTRTTALIAGLLVAGVLFLPAVTREDDPNTLHRKRLEATKATTKTKAKLLARSEKKALAEDAKEEAEQVAKRLAKLRKLNTPEARKAIREMRRSVAERWKKLSALSRDGADSWSKQQFGGRNQERAKQWRKELEDGKTDAFESALADLKKKAKALEQADPNDPETAKKKRDLERELKAMAQFAAKSLGNESLADTLSRAAEQLGLSDRPDLAKSALQAMEQSLELGAQELAELAKSLEAMKSLEEALRALQMANELGSRDQAGAEEQGASPDEKAQSMKELIERYKERLDGG